MTQDDESTGMFRNNFFDFKDENPRKRKQSSDISTGIAPLRCVLGIRVISKAKIDESHILPHTRSGLVRGSVTMNSFEGKQLNLCQRKIKTKIIKTFTKLY